MAERVFPNNLNVDMGSKIQFSGINWGEVEQNIKNPRFAQDSEAVMDLLKKLTGATEEEIEEAVQDLKEEGEKSEEPVDSDDTEKKEDSEEDGEEDGDKEPESDIDKEASLKTSSSNKMRKIAFTHPSQISAEAIAIAEAAGDIQLKNTILAARKANRLRIASAIQTNLKRKTEIIERKSQEQVNVKLAQSVDEQARSSIIDAIDNKNPVPQSFVDAYNASLSGEMKSYEGLDSDFKPTTAFSKAQRKAFAETALSQGMPIEYVNSICPPVVSDAVIKIAKNASEIVKSNISDETKKIAVASLIKEAKLSADSKSEFIDYWNNVLGYQDKAFWPLVAEDYTDKKVSE
jgi:Arc/MetJ-type ribon-helix-helix transcriptional regulator